MRLDLWRAAAIPLGFAWRFGRLSRPAWCGGAGASTLPWC